LGCMLGLSGVDKEIMQADGNSSDLFPERNNKYRTQNNIYNVCTVKRGVVLQHSVFKMQYAQSVDGLALQSDIPNVQRPPFPEVASNISEPALIMKQKLRVGRPQQKAFTLFSHMRIPVAAGFKVQTVQQFTDPWSDTSMIVLLT
jgi:hypothetical protein